MYEFKVETNDSRKYLVYQKKDTDQINTIVHGMINNNNFDTCTAYMESQVDSQISFRYDITGLQTIREYLQGVVRKVQLLKVLDGIIKIADEMEDYMLDMSAVVLNPEYIYIDPLKGRIYGIILPVFFENQPLEVFFKQMMFTVQYDQSEDCSYLANLLGCFNGDEPFSIKKLAQSIVDVKETCKKPKQSENVNQVTRTYGSQPPQATPIYGQAQRYQQPPAVSQMQVQPQSFQSYGQVQQYQQPPVVSQVQSQPQPVPTYAQMQPSQAAPAYGKMQPSQASPMYGQAQQFQPVPTMYVQEEPQPQPAASGKSFSSKLFGKDKKKNQENEKKGFFAKKEKPSVDKPEKNHSNMRISSFNGMSIPSKNNMSASQEDVKNESEIIIPKQNLKIETFSAPVENFGETTYLSGGSSETSVLNYAQIQNQSTPCLIRKMHSQVYKITKPVTSIGRNANQADIYVDGNPSVGRIHAYIYMENGKIFIEDNNSVNGTFIDGIRISTRKELNNGDIILLSNEEYQFLYM